MKLDKPEKYTAHCEVYSARRESRRDLPEDILELRV